MKDDRHRFVIHMTEDGLDVTMDGEKLHNLEQITVSKQTGQPPLVIVKLVDAEVDLFADAGVSEL